MFVPMIDFLMLLACVLTRLFRSRVRLEAEILVLRHQLNILQRKSTEKYFNDARTHLSLNKDAPASRAVQAVGRIVPTPHLGGLHHQYVRI